MVGLESNSVGSSTQLAIVRVCKTTLEWLKHAQELVALAIVDASMVKAFPGRWNAIRNKLEQLPCHLASLEECCSSSGNHSLCNELLQNIVSCLFEVKDLAGRCIEGAYGGKLQMQSSLDSLAMKLGMHVQECILLGKSGVLTVLSSQPKSSSSKEAVKCHVRDLLARVQIGKVEVKQKALDSLVELMQQDEKNVLVVSGQEGGVPTLVHLLNAGVSTLREKATAAVHCLAQSESCEHALVSEGALAPLVRLLEAGSPPAKEKAAAALRILTATSDNARSVAGHGGISALIEICQSGTPAAQAAAAGALGNLASIPHIRAAVAEEGAISTLHGLITSGTALAQENACDALQKLSTADEDSIKYMIREGAIQSLLMYYDASTSPKGKEAAMGIFSNLAASAANVAELVNAGFLTRLVRGLRSGLAVEQEASASAVCQMARSMELRRRLGEAGCIPPLVRMLEGKTSNMQALAAQALCSLILVDRNRRAFCKEEGGISRLVALLDPSNETVAKKFPLSALLCLSRKRKCRKQMVGAGARAHLVKLGDMEINGARNLLQRLEGGKVWTFFHV